MIRLIVSRPPADRPGQDIVEPLLSGSGVAARERGRIELDANSSPRERVSVEIDPQPGLAINTLAEVLEQGKAPWRGLIDSIRMEITASTDEQGRLVLARAMVLEIEREEQ